MIDIKFECIQSHFLLPLKIFSGNSNENNGKSTKTRCMHECCLGIIEKNYDFPCWPGNYYFETQ